MRAILIMFLGFLLFGCTASASLNNINGRYFWGGDPSCRGYKIINEYLIQCLNTNGQLGEYRRALNSQELSMYQHQNQMNQMQMQQNKMNMQMQQMQTQNNINQMYRNSGLYRY